MRFADDPEVRHRIVFLPNYDIAMAQYLYPGCDVWLNNPLRPFEACGTSGMKSALNGALNLSILDGWWDEWFDGENGWAIPTADGVEDPERRDDLEAAALYDLIEPQVAPRFYDRDEDGSRSAGWRWCATPSPRSARRCWPPGWCATTRAALRAGRPRRAGAERRGTPAPASWRPGRPGTRRVAGVRVDHVESSGVSDSPQVGDVAARAGFVSLDDLTPDDVEVQVVHGRTSEADDLGVVEPAPRTFAEPRSRAAWEEVRGRVGEGGGGGVVEEWGRKGGRRKKKNRRREV